MTLNETTEINNVSDAPEGPEVMNVDYMPDLYKVINEVVVKVCEQHIPGMIADTHLNRRINDLLPNILTNTCEIFFNTMKQYRAKSGH